MTALALMNDLARDGIAVSRAGNNLRAEGVVHLLTDELRLNLAERKSEMMAVLDGDWFGAAGALLLRHVARIPANEWWCLDEKFAKRVRSLVRSRMDRRNAEELAYSELAEAVDRVNSELPRAASNNRA